MSDSSPIPFVPAHPSFQLEPWDGVEFEVRRGAATLDLALKSASAFGGHGRITRNGEVVGYWGDVPETLELGAAE